MGMLLGVCVLVSVYICTDDVVVFFAFLLVWELISK